MLSLSSKKYGTQNKGFTLVEMLVIAPIVILTIGSFIALIVNLTGEVLSSRGSNTLTYNVQDALNRIESDVRLSTGFLATNNFALQSGQGNGGHNSTASFENVGESSGTMLILNTLVTNGDPMQLTTSTLYLANQPHSCTGTDDPLDYTKNRPMTMNIVYFTDSNGVLWRRSLMPSNYATSSVYCGSTAPWQQPSCMPGYATASPVPTFCRTNDVKLTDGVQNGNFAIEYFSNATSTTPIAAATNTATSADARGSALQAATTAKISLTTAKTIAGRDISRTGSLKVTRLDTNATSIATIAEPTTTPAIPVVTGTPQNGNEATFTWPAVSTATTYDLQYRLNGTTTWTTGRTNIPSNERSYTVPGTFHGDRVEVQVRARNIRGTSAYGQGSTNIPYWTSLATENNWGEYSTNWAPPSYTKTRAGVVMLRGMVAGGSGNTSIAKLPDGYRPGTKMLFASTSYDLLSRLDIDVDGSIIQRTGNTTWHSLDGIAFLAGSPAATDITALLNGWVVHNATDWHAPSYTTDTAGRIHLRGMVRGGSTTTASGGVPTLGTGILTVPTAARPAAQNFYTPQVSSDFHGMVGYNTGGQLRVRGGPTPNFFLSMNMIYYPSSRATGSNCATQWCALPLQNSWASYGSSFTTPQYTKATDGIVHLKGTVRLGTTGRIAELPQAYCPTTKLLMTVSTNDTSGRVDIVPNPAGGCYIDAMVYNNAWVSLDGIKYIADQ